MTTDDRPNDDKIREDYDWLKRSEYFGKSSLSFEDFKRFIAFKSFLKSHKADVTKDGSGGKKLLLLALRSFIPKEPRDLRRMEDEIPVDEIDIDGILIEEIPGYETLVDEISEGTLAEDIPKESFGDKIPLDTLILITGIIAAFIAAIFVCRTLIIRRRPQQLKHFLLIAVEKDELKKIFHNLDNLASIAIKEENKEDFLKTTRFLLADQSDGAIKAIKNKMNTSVSDSYIVLGIKLIGGMSAFRDNATFYEQKEGFNNLTGKSLTILGKAGGSLLREHNFRQAKY